MQRQGEYDYVTKIEFHKTFPFSVSVIPDRSVIIICDREPPNHGEALVTGFEGGLGFRAGAILTRQSLTWAGDIVGSAIVDSRQ